MWRIWTCRYERSEARALIKTEEDELTGNEIVKGVGKWSPGYSFLKWTANVFEEILTMCLRLVRVVTLHVYQSI